MRTNALRLLCVLSFVLLTDRSLLADDDLNRARAALVEAEIEKMKGMSDAQSLSYLRTSSTLRDLQVVGVFLRAYQMKYGRYPAARSMAELETMLVPELMSELTTKDKWGTELRYVVSKDGQSYRLISAGADETFDEGSWTKKGKLAFADEDAVLENEELVRAWTEETQPGLGSRAKLQPRARTLLAQADQRLEAEDHAGALAAYMEAVKADRMAADLEAIRRYAPPSFLSVPPPPPPPPPPLPNRASTGAGASPQPKTPVGATASHITALRQFLEIHPGHAEAERDLVIVLPAAEGEAFAAEMVKRQPRDPELYRLRSQLRFRAGKYAEGLADLEDATTLDPGNAELYFILAVTSYEMVAKGVETSEPEKRELIRRGLAALDRAESLRADYFEALAYRNLLLREQAKLESDTAVQRKLIEEADAVRKRAVAVIQARRGAPPPPDRSAEPDPPPPTGSEPFRVGGDVKAPVIQHRVEPVIPEAARQARISGIVIIEAVIDKEGRVADAKVLKPLPFGLDRAALEAIKQWTFMPGTLNGEAVDVIFNLTVNIRPE